MYAILKEKAIKLRKQGYSLNYISRELKIAKSTLNYWFRNVPYIPNEETTKRVGDGKLKSALTKNKQKLESIRKATEESKQEVSLLTKRDLYMLGLGLYMGEGAKTSGLIRVINSNPNILWFAVQWLKKVYGLTNENFSVAIHLYPDNDVEKCLSFWSEKLNIPLNQFGKTQIDKRENKKLFKRGKLPYGTAHLTIKSGNNPKFGIFLFRKIIAATDNVIGQAGMV